MKFWQIVKPRDQVEFHFFIYSHLVIHNNNFSSFDELRKMDTKLDTYLDLPVQELIH